MGNCLLIASFLIASLLLSYGRTVHAVVSVTPTAASLPAEHLQKHYSFQFFTQEGLESIGALWAIAEDAQGFMWFGGENGLARFDGYEVTLYRNDPENKNSISSSYIHDLLVDKQGRLWVGTNYGLNLYRPATDDFTHYFNVPNNPISMSGSGVRCLLQDSRGNIWIGHGEGGLSRFEPDIEYFEQFSHRDHDPNSLAENSVYALAEDNNGNLWIGTNTQGLDRIAIDQARYARAAKFEHFKHDPKNPNSLSANPIRSLLVDKLNQVWIGTTEGLNRYNTNQGTFTRFVNNEADPYSLSFDFVQDLAEDSEGNLWVATSGAGLNLFNREKLNFARFSNNPSDKSSVYNNNVRTMFLDSNGNFWLGHSASGISMVDRYASAFTNIQHNPFLSNSLNYNEIVSVVENEQGDLWIGTSKGLNFLNRKTGEITRYEHSRANPKSINQGGVLSLLYDNQKRLWAGLWQGGLNQLNYGTADFIRYTAEADSKTGLFSNTVWGLLQDADGRIWVGNHLGGLTYLDEETHQFIRIPQGSDTTNGMSCSSVFALYQDSKKNLWVGCSNGLYLRQHGHIQFQHFYHDDNNPTSISASHIWAIQEDKDGIIWVGTQGGGVNRFDAKSKTFDHFRVKDGLADDLVTGILQDDMGYLWFATGNGLSRFDPSTKDFKNFDQRHGLPGNVFNRAAFLKTQKNELVFGSKDGLTIFNPHALYENRIPPPVVITDFHLFNKSITVGDANSPLKKAISQTQSLNLTYKQSSFSFQFSALNYRVTSMNRYAYKLEGFDQDWIQSGTRRWAYYTNLNPGHYVFKVKASNNDGVWNEQGKAIDIVISPPWWRTVWAYLGYLLIFLCMASLVGYTFWQKKIVENERRISDRLREIDKVKDSFLANTSHELRTPLHGMIGLAESLINGVTGPLSDETKHYLNMIIISGRRLANLVNDILDFAKLRESKISLRKVPVDLRSVTEIVVALFEPMLRDRNIQLINRVDRNIAFVLADENRLQQILYNLIGNAVKFSDDKGEIEIFVTDQNDVIQISVKDNGIGIAEDKQEAVFESFQQIEFTGDRGVAGTGLGLTVTKQLVELHGGTMSLISKLGEGSTFSFTLPKAKAGLKPLVKSLDSYTQKDQLGNSGRFVFSKNPKAAAKDPSEDIIAEPIHHILVVDDEPVNRLVLDGFLRIKNYRITEASSGIDALEILSKPNDIALVLLDVMMPKMTGFETCKIIRERYTAKELPVIFLTGKNLREDLEAGFDAGGNDFLTKPVAKEELLLRVHTHLKLADGVSK